MLFTDHAIGKRENAMTVFKEILWGFFGLVVVLLLSDESYFAAIDASKRGFSGIQVLLLRVLGVIFFPVSIVAYLIFRPSLRQQLTADRRRKCAGFQAFVMTERQG